MPKRKRKETETKYSKTNPEESDETVQERFPDDSGKKKQRQKKRASKSKECKRLSAVSKQKQGDKDMCVPKVNLSHESSDCNENSDALNEVPSEVTQNSKDLQCLLSLSKSCKEHLMRVVSTAVQFQRHSHQQKLCSSHFSKALAFHDFSLESEDSDDSQDLNWSESEYQ